MPGFTMIDPMEHITIKLRWAHIWFYEKEWSALPYTKPFTTFWFFEKGNALLQINGEELKINSGDLLILAPDMTQEVVAGSENTLYYSLGADLKYGEVDLLHLCHFPLCSTLDRKESFLDSWEQLVRFAEKLVGRFGIVSEPRDLALNPFKTVEKNIIYPSLAKLDGMVRLWLAELFSVLSEEHSLEIKPTNKNVIKAMGYIRKNVGENISMDTLSEVTSLSKSHLRHLFNRELGIPPSQFIRNVQIRRAKDYLLSTNMNICEVAEAVGFEDIHYFSRVFHKEEGVSPSDYRTRAREGAF